MKAKQLIIAVGKLNGSKSLNEMVLHRAHCAKQSDINYYFLFPLLFNPFTLRFIFFDIDIVVHIRHEYRRDIENSQQIVT